MENIFIDQIDVQIVPIQSTHKLYAFLIFTVILSDNLICLKRVISYAKRK